MIKMYPSVLFDPSCERTTKMPEIHPENHPNDPFFPRSWYNQKRERYVPLTTIINQPYGGLPPVTQTVEEVRENIAKESYKAFRDRKRLEADGDSSIEAWREERMNNMKIVEDIIPVRTRRAPDPEVEVPDQRPLFFSFVGGDGSGKSTQSARLYEYLQKCNVPVLWTREPGSTDLGMILRKILTTPELAPQSRIAELMLFQADRAEHVETIIKPALNSGTIVICDRYTPCTMAYQSYAGGLDEKMVRQMNKFATGGLVPDLTFWLDVLPPVGVERAKKVGGNRYEDMDKGYHWRVRNGYASEMPKDGSWVRLDATKRNVRAIAKSIRKIAFQKCEEYGYLPEKPEK